MDRSPKRDFGAGGLQDHRRRENIYGGLVLIFTVKNICVRLIGGRFMINIKLDVVRLNKLKIVIDKFKHI